MDTEEKQISVLLICKSPKKYRLVMKQLAQDGWAVGAVASVKKALQLIIEKPPTHVFLSANVAGTSLLKVSKIITTTFNLPVVLFAESHDFQTLKILRETKWPHILPTSISAPLIRSKIRLIMGGDEQAATGTEGPSIRTFGASKAEPGGSGLIKIEGKIKSKRKTRSTNEETETEDESSDDFYFQGKKVKKINDFEEPDEELESDEDLIEFGAGASSSNRRRDESDSDEVIGDDDLDEMLEAYDDSGEVSDELAKEKLEKAKAKILSKVKKRTEEDETETFEESSGVTAKARNTKPSKARYQDNSENDDPNENEDSDVFSLRAAKKKKRKTIDESEDVIAAAGQIDNDGMDYTNGVDINKQRRRHKDDDESEEYTHEKSEEGGEIIPLNVKKRRTKKTIIEENFDTVNKEKSTKTKRKKSKYDDLRPDDEALGNLFEKREAKKRNKKNSPKRLSKRDAEFYDDSEDFDYESNRDLPQSRTEKVAANIPEALKSAIEASLLSVIKPGDFVRDQADNATSFVAYYIQSKKLSGVVYLAVGKANAIASGLIGSFMKSLTENLKLSKIEAFIHRPVLIQVKPLNMREWLEKKCNFVIKSCHEDCEVVMGYLSDNEIQPHFSDSHLQGMFHVDVKHFPVNYPLNMDLYVYLPINKKTIKYIGKKGYLEKKQKDRLQKNEISAFHLLNEDILQVRDFFVKLYTKKKLAA